MIRILIPLDGSSAAEKALIYALYIARVFPAEFTLLRVIAESDNETPAGRDSIDFALWRHQAQEYLDGLLAAHASPEVTFRCEVAEGNPAETIVQFMRRTKPDLLVLTRYGHGNAQDFGTGGTAQKVLLSTDCSVMLLDPGKPVDPDLSFHRILVSVDENKDSDCAVAVAAMIADIHSAKLVLLQIIEQPHLPRGFPATVHARQLVNEMKQIIQLEAERRIKDLAARIPKHIALETQTLVSPEAALAIESTAEDYDSDLLVLHIHKGGQDDGCRYSSVNQSLILYSHRPLFILQASASEGFLSNFRSVYIDEQRREAG
jgi:nucleotide-binding universal stress UspA family protein